MNISACWRLKRAHLKSDFKNWILWFFGSFILNPSPRGRYEEIQFWFPSLVRRGRGGGRKPCWTNPLESPLTKGDTRRATPKPILSHLRGTGKFWTLFFFTLGLGPGLFALPQQKGESPETSAVPVVDHLPPDYFPMHLGDRWIYLRTDSRFKKSEQIVVQIINTSIIKWKTYYVFNRLPFVPRLENANNVLVRYDPDNKRFLYLLEGKELPLFPVGLGVAAKFDASVDENGKRVFNRLSYLTCVDCEDQGMEMVFDQGVGVTAVLITYAWGTESFDMRSADVNLRHYGETIREDPKKSPKGANRGGPVVSRADPEIRVEVEKSNSKAHLVMRVKNPTESYLSLHFTTSQTYDFIIRDKETGKEVWRWSKGNFYSRVRRNVAILPEAEWRFEFFWDFKNSDRDELTHGVYEVSAVLTTREPRESEPITITVP